MTRFQAGSYSQHGNHGYNSAMQLFDQHEFDSAAVHYQETGSYYSAHENIDDADEYEESLCNTIDARYNRLNEMSQHRQSSQFPHSTQRRDSFNENAVYHQQNAQSAANLYHLPRSNQGYVEDGPSSLQTRLDSFAVPRNRRTNVPPSNEDRLVRDSFQPSPDNDFPSSPTPNNALNAQSSNLAPVSLPVRMEFSAPADFVPMEAVRGNNARRDAGAYLSQLTVTYLPQAYQRIFNFKHFNKAQSVAFRDLYLKDKNVVVTAPTGAGKTTLFELAFLNMLNNHPEGKAVYLAPMKALCSERFQDWSDRLKRINCKVLMMTGDTKHKSSDAHAARLIIATPEKWDQLTRHANSSDHIMPFLRLFLIDEVHIVREMRRGAVMEVVVARMKAYSSEIRFVAVSATIPNASDFALWIGKRDNDPRIITDCEIEKQGSDAAQLYTFSEAFRPCPLTKYVYGYRNPRRDVFALDRELNARLPGIIHTHSNNKGSIIFCSTRKFSSGSAHFLAKMYSEKQKNNDAELPWTVPRNRPDTIDTEDPHLGELYAFGIGFHHAGLSYSDRKKIEIAFLQGHLIVLCCTSSLAVGVNLPAYLVVIRGTLTFDNGEWRDYGDLDVFQMMGRAGRPQFDTEGVCVIMTDQEHKARWADLLKGESIVESTLHHSLIEHANAEIVVRHSCSVRDIRSWLRSTFFYVRLSQKPEYYKLSGCEEVADADEALYVTSRRIMTELSENNLVEDYNEDNDEQQVFSSEFGVIMAKYSLRFETMQALLKVQHNSSIEKLIEIMSHAAEFDRILLRSGEKGLYEDVRKLEGVRFPPSAINEVSDKISTIFQAQLAGYELENLLRKEGHMLSLNPRQDVSTIMEHAPNVARALLNIAIINKDGGTARSAFELLRCSSGGAWEGTQAELLQINGIGPAFMQTLGEAGITTLENLAREKADRIQLLLGRSLSQAKGFILEARRYPRFTVQVKESMGRIIEGKGVESRIEVSIELNHSKNDLKKLLLKREGGQAHNVAFLITTTNSNSNTCLWGRAPLPKMLEEDLPLPIQTIILQSPDEEVVVTVACEALSGKVTESRVRSSCPSHKFPVIEKLEESETENMASSISELRENELPKSSKIEATQQKKNKVQEVASNSKCTSKSTGSNLLRELQQFDGNVSSRDIKTVEPVSRKTMEEKVIPVKTSAKKSVLPALSKKGKEEAHKRGLDEMREKVKRHQQRKAAEKKAAREKRERIRLLKEEETSRAKDPSPVQEDSISAEVDCSDDEIVRIQRKKLKPADWNFRIGAIASAVEDDEIMEPQEYDLMDCYSPDYKMNEEPLHGKQTRKVEPEQEGSADLGIPDAKDKKIEYIIIDGSDDEEQPASLQRHEKEDEDKCSDMSDRFYSHYQDDIATDHYSLEDHFDNQVDKSLDWHQDNKVHNKYQEEETNTEELDIEDRSGYFQEQEMSQNEKIVKNRERLETEGPFFHAPPISLRTTAGIPFTRELLAEIEEDTKVFDPEYIKELLNNYD